MTWLLSSTASTKMSIGLWSRNPMSVIKIVSWSEAKKELSSIRLKVFVEEQNVPLGEEIDGKDPDCTQFLALNANNTPVACARLSPDGQIGRMAVLMQERGTGLGAQLLSVVVKQALKEKHTNIHLHAQTQALEFYHKAGFVVEGEEFMDAGIPHLNMIYLRD